MRLRRATRTGRDWHRHGVRVAALVSALWLAAGDVLAQSLADLAAREEARRAAIVTPARVYTNVPLTDQDTAGTR